MNIIITFSITVLAFLFIYYGDEPDRNAVFTNNLISKLRENGGEIPASSIQADDWTEICRVIEYQNASDKAAAELAKYGGALTTELAEQLDYEPLLDGEFGLLFLYPPNNAKFYIVIDYPGSSQEDCLKKEDAYLKIVNKSNTEYIRLVKKDIEQE